MELPSGLVGAVYLSRAAIGMERAADDDATTPPQVLSMLDPWLGGCVVVLVVLVLAAADMVFKPGAG